MDFGILDKLVEIVKVKNGKNNIILTYYIDNCFFYSDKSELPDTNHHTFFSEGGYKVYGINKQFVPRKLSLSFDIKTFDENSLIYLAITVSKIELKINTVSVLIFSIELSFSGRLSTVYHSSFRKWIC